MKTPRTRIAKTIASQTTASGVTAEYARSIAAYLLETGRVRELDSILRDVQNEWIAAGYVEIMARTAHTLEASAKKSITAQVSPLFPKATISVTEIIDPAVLGGVELSVGDQRLDLSIEAKLNRFKRLTGAGKE